MGYCFRLSVANSKEIILEKLHCTASASVAILIVNGQLEATYRAATSQSCR